MYAFRGVCATCRSEDTLTSQQIDPGNIGTPTQLMAGCLALLLVVEPALIIGASTVSEPSWIPGLFAIAAVINVPLVLIFFYMLHTRHRHSLLSDAEYAGMLREVRTAGPRLEKVLREADVNLDEVLAGRVPKSYRNSIEVGKEVESAASAVTQLEQVAGAEVVPPDVLLSLATGFLVEQKWSDAAQYLDAYVAQVDGDWKAHFSRGVAHANSRRGRLSDLAALRAYDDALALAPQDAPPYLIARLYSYRGAIKKRLGRLLEARADVRLAKSMADSHYELLDATYNSACIEVMSGDEAAVLTELRELKELGGLELVLAHLDDYFGSLREHPEFKELVGNLSKLSQGRSGR